MIKRFTLCLLVVALSATLAFSHGDPLIGTVTAVGKDTVTIKDKDGKSIVVMVDKDTKYMDKDKKALALSAVTAGVRVVIDAHMDAKMKMYSAESVQIGVAAPETKGDKPAAKKDGPKP